MRVVYITPDGMEHTSEKAAARHEAELFKYLKLWDGTGEETTDPNNAMVVYLQNEKAAGTFVGMCQEAMADYDGISTDSVGLYYWNDWNREYVYIDPDSMTGLATALKYCETVDFEYPID